MKLSFHIANIPSEEEFYMGVNANYDAYFVDIPDEFIPKGVLDAANDKSKFPRRRITSIAIHKE